MKWSVSNNGCVEGCGGSAWTSKLILSRFGMERVKVMEKLKIRRGIRRSFSTITLLQIYGLKVSLGNLTM